MGLFVTLSGYACKKYQESWGRDQIDFLVTIQLTQDVVLQIEMQPVRVLAEQSRKSVDNPWCQLDQIEVLQNTGLFGVLTPVITNILRRSHVIDELAISR